MSCETVAAPPGHQTAHVKVRKVNGTSVITDETLKDIDTTSYEIRRLTTLSDVPEEVFDENIFYKMSCEERTIFCETDKKSLEKCQKKKHLFLCALEKIRKGVESDGAHVRAGALLALGSLGELAKDDVNAVAKGMDDGNWTVRHAAMKALGAYGVFAKDHVAAVVAKMRDPDDLIKETLPFYLVEEGSQLNSSELNRYSDRVSAMEAVAAFGEVARPYVSDIKEVLDHAVVVDNYEMIKNGLLALGALKELNENHIDAIAKKIKEKKSHRFHACEAMMVFVDFGRLVKREHIKIIRDTIIESQGTIESLFYDYEAMKALGAFGKLVQKKDVQIIIGNFDKYEKIDIMNAIIMLGKIGELTEDAEVRDLVVNEIQKYTKVYPWDLWDLRMDSTRYEDSLQLSLTAMEEFAKLEKDFSPEMMSVQTILAIANRCAGTIEYAQRGGFRGLSLLSPAARTRLLRQAVRMLGIFKTDSTAAEFVVNMLKHEHQWVRGAATKTLKEFRGLNSEGYAEKVAEMVDDEFYSVRLQAVQTLGAFGEHSLRHVLKMVTVALKADNFQTVTEQRIQSSAELGRAMGTTLKEIFNFDRN